MNDNHFCGCDMCGDRVFGKIEKLEAENAELKSMLKEANRRLRVLMVHGIHEDEAFDEVPID